MVTSCCAYGCTQRQKKGGISFHRFPSDPKLNKKWTDALKRKNFKPTPATRICGKHFLKENFLYYFGKLTLTKGAVPSIFPEHLRKKKVVPRNLTESGPCKIVKEQELCENHKNYENNPGCSKRNICKEEGSSSSEVKVEADDADVHLGISKATFEDNSNELSYDPLDYVDEIKTEADDGDVYSPPTQASLEDNVNETSHDRAEYVSEVKTEADEIDIKEEELVSPSPINSVHAKRKRLDIEHASMDFTDPVEAMKSPLREDEDLAFFYSLLPSVRSLNTDQKFTFRLKTIQLLQDIRNSF